MNPDGPNDEVVLLHPASNGKTRSGLILPPGMGAPEAEPIQQQTVMPKARLAADQYLARFFPNSSESPFQSVVRHAFIMGFVTGVQGALLTAQDEALTWKRYRRVLEAVRNESQIAGATALQELDAMASEPEPITPAASPQPEAQPGEH